MIGMPAMIGNAPDSWGVWFSDDPRQPGWKQYLDEVAKAGYAWTELGPYGYLPTDVSLLRDELSRRSLRLCGEVMSFPLEDPAIGDSMERELATVGRLVKALGGEFMILITNSYADFFTGAPRQPKELGAAAWTQLVKNTMRAARFVQNELGLKLAFHPAAGTNVEHEHQIERLLQDTDPDMVGLCFDTGHHVYVGGNVVPFMRKHHARITYLHLKNVSADACAHANDEGMLFATAVGRGGMTCLDEGVIDFVEVKKVIDEKKIAVPIIVEQDMFPTPFDKPLPLAIQNRSVLRKLGFG
jgi:inosose dehydratase